MSREETKEIVRRVLTTSISSRDNDEELMLHVWNTELDQQGRDILHTGAMDLCLKLVSGNLSKPDSITRYRRLLQAKDINLRGDNWSKRHDMMKIWNALK